MPMDMGLFMARALETCGVERLVVGSVAEGMAVRVAGIRCPVLALSDPVPGCPFGCRARPDVDRGLARGHGVGLAGRTPSAWPLPDGTGQGGYGPWAFWGRPGTGSA